MKKELPPSSSVLLISIIRLLYVCTYIQHSKTVHLLHTTETFLLVVSGEVAYTTLHYTTLLW